MTHYAASRGHYNIFKWLVQEEGFDSNATNKDGSTHLMWAAQFGKLDFIKAFKVDNHEFDFTKLLEKSIKKSKIEVGRFLIAQGVNLRDVDLDDASFSINVQEDIIIDIGDNFIELLRAGFLADAIYKNNTDAAKNYLTNHDIDFSLVLERLSNLCKQNGIPYYLLNAEYLPKVLQVQINEKINSIKHSPTYISNQIEVHVSDLNNYLDKIKFPCKRLYSNFVAKFSEDRSKAFKVLTEMVTEKKINEPAPYPETIDFISRILKHENNKTLTKDEVDVITSLISYNLEPYYQPYNFFIYMINPVNRQDILEIFMKYHLQADSIFASLKNIVVDIETFRNFKNLKDQYANPPQTIYKKIISDYHHDIEKNVSIVEKLEKEISNIKNKSSEQSDSDFERNRLLEQGSKNNNKITNYFTKLLVSNKRTLKDFGDEKNPKDSKIRKTDTISYSR